MSYTFRTFRQVKIIRRGDAIDPQVEGVEEIYCNGQKKVRYWNEPKSLRTQAFDDGSLLDFWGPFWRELPLFEADESRNWIDSQPSDRSPRYTSYQVVERDKIAEPAGHKPLPKLSQAFVRGTRKIHKIFRNIPSALKAAWKELNQ